MKNILTSDQIAKKIENLVAQFNAWENGLYKASNDELYNILGGSLDFFVQIKGNRKLIKFINLELDQRGITYNSGTSLAVKIIRLIFGDCGNRVYIYANVISEAEKQNVDSVRLSKWIIDNNGVENISKQKSGKDKPTEAQNAEAGAELCSTIDAVFEVKKPKKAFLPKENAIHPFSVALIREGENGSAEIVFGTNKESIVNKVLGEANRALSDNSNAANELNASQQKHKNIATAVKSAKAVN